MTETVMICLIGEQPAPNLLPVRHYQPDKVLLVHSDFTRGVADNLKRMLAVPTDLCLVPAYDIAAIQQAILDKITEHGWSPQSLLLNLTGGTKLMMLAAYQLAQSVGDCRLIYLNSEGGRSDCYEYRLATQQFVNDQPSPVTIRTVITIEDYLAAQGLGAFQEQSHTIHDDGTRFEACVYTALQAAVPRWLDQVCFNLKGRKDAALQMDLLVRYGNQIGLIEAKQGNAGERHHPGLAGIKQLNTFGGPLYLGRYARRILVLSRDLALNAQEVAEAQNITFIVLPSFETSGKRALSADDITCLQTRVASTLGNRAAVVAENCR